MGTSISVSRSNFDTEVLAKSHEKPVLLDFFAQWCGPCQMLKPILERLTQEYDFVLAKVDIDANPDLAGEYGVEGVPDVKIVQNGQVTDGFVGALPEPELRDLLAQLNLKSVIDLAIAKAESQAQAGNVEAAQEQINELLQKFPDNAKLSIDAATFYIQTNLLEAAEQQLAKISEYNREFYPAAKQLKALILFKRVADEPVGTNPLDQTYQQAAQAALNQDFETALMLFLEVVSRDRKYKNDAGRKAMVAIFDVLGDDHPVSRHYRKALTTALY
jgi:putative thioredoxin